ncbi:MAG TPA: OsmC family protein [Planctomycetota bacterium]|nr:OsmC family protein [Planctomycetota bacterium]
MTAPLPRADAVCDGGDLDCGSGLLLIIRRAMDPLPAGGVLEVRSREGSVREDLPAWCRMTENSLLATAPGEGTSTSYFVRKGGADALLAADLEKARAFAWTVRVRWTEGMRATAYARNHAIPLGQPASLDTADPAPAAVEALLASLGGCLAVGFQWRLSAKGIAVRNLEVSLKARSANLLVYLGAEDAGHPGLERIEGSCFVDADADQALLRAIWEETLRRSPVAQTILRGAPIALEVKPS